MTSLAGMTFSNAFNVVTFSHHLSNAVFLDKRYEVKRDDGLYSDTWGLLYTPSMGEATRTFLTQVKSLLFKKDRLWPFSVTFGELLHIFW